MQRIDSGSWRLRAAPGRHSGEPSSSTRSRAIAVCRPPWGRARASAGWITDRFARNASMLSAAEICIDSSRSAPSIRTSEPRPIVTPLEAISPSASLGPSDNGSSPARSSASSPRITSPSYSAQPRPITHLADVGHLRQVALADRADHPHDRVHAGVQQRHQQLDQLAGDADARLQHPVDA